MAFLGRVDIAACVAGAISSEADAAQNASTWPEREMVSLVPCAVGWPAEILPHLVGQKPQEHFGQIVITENMPGGNGLIDGVARARANAAGHTIHLMDLLPCRLRRI